MIKSKKKSRWKGRNILITGGSGFVGYWVASTLAAKGARVTILDPKPLPSFSVIEGIGRKNFKYVCGLSTAETLVTKILQTNHIQSIFHLGAEAIVTEAQARPGETLDKNVRGTWVLLECARAYGKVTEIVIASSDKAYGSHDTLPYREDFALQGKHPYDVSKSCTDLIAKMYAHSYGMPVAIARCGNIYGGGDQNKSRLIPDALQSLLTEKTFLVRSNGKFKRDYIYIDDIVNAYLCLAENLKNKKLWGEAFNFGNDTPLTVLEVLNLIEKASEKKLKIQILNQAKYEIRDQYLDSRKASRMLGWRAHVSHTEGFAATAKWYADFFKNNGRLEK